MGYISLDDEFLDRVASIYSESEQFYRCQAFLITCLEDDTNSTSELVREMRQQVVDAYRSEDVAKIREVRGFMREQYAEVPPSENHYFGVFDMLLADLDRSGLSADDMLSEFYATATDLAISAAQIRLSLLRAFSIACEPYVRD